ncbi:MAG: hypothetical protein ABIA08_02705 [bacterium]
MTEIIPKELPKLPGWLNILFYVLIFLLIISIVSFFILNNSLDNSLKNLEDLETVIDQEKALEDISLETEVLSYKVKIQDFKTLSEEHKANTKSFTFLEETTHPLVWFSSFELFTKESKLLLSGKTKNFESLGQQLLVLKEREELNDFRLISSAINKEGQIDFNLLIYFKPGFLNAKD